jgi:GntR family transcriptional regulator
MISFRLDKKSPVPFYRQIVDRVLAGISGGQVEPGDRLPTIRDLAVHLGVNPNTVVKAYTELQILGVLHTQQGSGVFVQAAGPAMREGDRQRATEDLCLDFVGRAQLLNISVDDLLACLKGMKTGQKKEKPR